VNGIRSTEALTRGRAAVGNQQAVRQGEGRVAMYSFAKLRDPRPLKSRIKNLDCHQIQLFRIGPMRESRTG
jgi:hypothetical protein